MSKIYSAKVSGSITEKVSSSSGIDSLYIDGVKHQILGIEFDPDAQTSLGNDLPCAIIHYDDGDVYLPASNSLDALYYILHPLQ